MSLAFGVRLVKETEENQVSGIKDLITESGLRRTYDKLTSGVPEQSFLSHVKDIPWKTDLKSSNTFNDLLGDLSDLPVVPFDQETIDRAFSIIPGDVEFDTSRYGFEGEIEPPKKFIIRLGLGNKKKRKAVEEGLDV